MIVFVILHYQDADITYQCVAAIEKIMKESEYHIVIVDNASPYEIGMELEEYYKENSHCTVLLNKQNLGFAKGNDVGYLYAKKNFSPQYIVVMNNDVMIEDSDFFQKVENIYQETQFDILGPNIIQSRTGQKQNPMRMHSKDELLHIYKSYRRKHSFPRLYFTIETLQGKVKRKLGRQRSITVSEKKTTMEPMVKRIYNPILHGACYICSKKFIQCEDELFDPRTFLYWEEYLLWIKCNERKYTLVYDSSVSVQHLSGHATVKAQQDAYKRTKDFYHNYPELFTEQYLNW